MHVYVKPVRDHIQGQISQHVMHRFQEMHAF